MSSRRSAKLSGSPSLRKTQQDNEAAIGTAELRGISPFFSLYSHDDPRAAELAPIDAEFLVNTTTLGHQFEPVIAALAGGGFVIVWSSPNQDGDGSGVYSQRYDASGFRIGGETRVNSTTQGHQSQPAIAPLSDGGYVIVWESYLTTSDRDIYAQRFDSSGATQGTEFRVNTTTEGTQVWAKVAALDNGGFVIVWSSNAWTAPQGVYAQHYNQSGAAVGGEVRATADPTGAATPQIATLENGNYVIVWSSTVEDGFTFDVYMRLFSASGTPLGAETKINTTTSGDQLIQAVAALADGGFVVAWMQGNDEIVSQRFSASGTPVGGEARVDGGPFTLFGPSVIGLPTGGYAMTFTSISGGERDVFVQLYDALGLPQGPIVLVNSNPDGDQYVPVIASLAGGDLVVSWVDQPQVEWWQQVNGEIKARLVSIGEPVDAVVDRNVALEMIRLAAEAYGSPGAAHQRGWRLLTIADLGILPSGNEGGLNYSFGQGLYRAFGPTPLGPNEADAFVLRAIIGGKLTLAIAFRGTDEKPEDFGDYFDFGDHYAKFAPLIAAIDAYLASHPEIERVLVSGHSLGAAMVQEFMATHGGDRFRAFTIGSPGGDNPGGNDADSRIVNFGHTDDIVFQLAPGATNASTQTVFAAMGVVSAPAGALAALLATIEEKDRQGSTVFINSEIGSVPWFGEHDSWSYLSDLQRMFDFATDGISPFRLSGLGTAIADGRVYSGAPVYVAIGDTRDAAAEDISIHWRDDWVLGSVGNDRFEWELIPNPAAHLHHVDGGAGTDILVLTGLRSSWSWQAAGGGYQLFHSGHLVGELVRVEKLVFGFFGGSAVLNSGLAPSADENPEAQFVVYLDGSIPAIQHPAAGETVVMVDADADYLDAGDGNLSITGTGGANVILLGNGTQSVMGLGGNDIITANAADGAPVGQLLVAGGSGNDFLTGDADRPERMVAVFSGNRADYSATVQGDRIVVTDLRDGSPDGTDTLQQVGRFRFLDGDFTTNELLVANLAGGDGPDIFTGGVEDDMILGNGGNDVLSGGDLGDDLLDGGPGDDSLIGGPGNDLVLGGAGGDYLDGGAGSDRMEGGAGDDLYVVDTLADVVVETAGNGNDRIVTSISYALGNLDIETLEAAAGNAPIVLTGNGFAQTLIGNNGANLLDGGAGADVLRGGTGNDTYLVDLFADQVIEASGEGNDAVYTEVSYQLGAGQSVELLAARDNSQTIAMALIGNELNNGMLGNNGANFMDGGAGADQMTGFGGDDIYAVDNAGDVVIELAGQGNDAIYTTFSYQLGFGSSVELLASRDNTQTVAMALIGNELNNGLLGNNGANFLDGGLGADQMTGFGGDDVYAVDNAGDVVIEEAGQGNDSLYTTFSYVLGFGSSVELLAARENSLTVALTLAGNELNNTILGNNGANFIDGQTGADLMAGYSGDDTYIVDNAGDRVVEETGRGNDAVYVGVSFVLEAGSSVELIGTRDNSLTLAINLTGNELANGMLGNHGANILDGKGGADTMFGFGGADTFAFTSAIGTGTGNVDTIADFLSGTDKLALDDAVFTAIGSPGALNAGAFVTGTAAADANDRIIYNAATAQLFYDADGNGAGAAILFATLNGNPVIAAGDFMVI